MTRLRYQIENVPIENATIQNIYPSLKGIPRLENNTTTTIQRRFEDLFSQEKFFIAMTSELLNQSK